MKILFKACCLLSGCLLTSGCLITHKVKNMETREIVYHTTTDAYLLKNNKLLVHYTPSNKQYDSYYSVWDRSQSLKSSYGTFKNYKYYTPDGDYSKTVKMQLSEDTSHVFGTPFPNCEISILEYSSKEYGDLHLTTNPKDFGDFYSTKNPNDYGVPFVFGDVSKLCDGVELLTVRDLGDTISLYVKNKENNKSVTTYNKYRLRELVWSQAGDNLIYMEILKYTLMPFAVVADIVTSPIQIFFIPYMAGGPGRTF